MFKQDVTTTYNLEDATYEIAIMLIVSFLLGYLLHYFMTKKSTVTEHTDEAAGLLTQLGKTQTELEKTIKEKAEIKKAITIEYSTQIDELKSKLTTARADLEKCLASKATSHSPRESANRSAGPLIPNDLKIIEGIGPALAKVLNQAGITTFEHLSNNTEESLRGILSNAGSRFKVHDPSTWPEQAKLAANEDWEQLKTYQEKLNTNK